MSNISKIAYEIRRTHEWGGKTYLLRRVRERARQLKANAISDAITTKALINEVERQAALRAARARAKPEEPLPLALRLKRRLIAICNEQILQRGLTTPAGWWDAYKRLDHDPATRLWVVSAEYRHQYSRRESWWTGASYLCGWEDGQHWAIRIPRTIVTVAEALAWVEPAPVRRARAEGRKVLRQGDWFFVPLRRGEDDLTALSGSGHIFDPEARVVRHPQHGELFLSPDTPYRAYQTKAVADSVGLKGD